MTIKQMIFLLFVLSLAAGVNAQSPDPAIKKQVISSGGGVAADTVNNVYSITGAIGQPVASPKSTNGPTGVSAGFFSGNLLPLAAGVSISGRVRTADGRGLRSVLVTVTDLAGITHAALTGPRGRFMIEGLEAGRTYTVSVASRRYTFTPQVVSLTEDLVGMDLISQ